MYRTLGPYSIASWLRKHNVKSQVIEFANKWNPIELAEITSRLVSLNGFVGTSSTFWEYDAINISNVESNELISARIYLRKIRPDIKFIVGGANAKKAPDGAFDIIVSGFGEDKIIKILNNGIGQIWHPTLEENQFYEGDAIIENESLPMALGRGCRFACKFCSYPLIGRKPGTYERTQDNILNDYDSRLSLGASPTVSIMDDTINESDERIFLLENLKKNDQRFEWGGYLRADLIWSKEDQQERLPNSGLVTTFHGIESLHPYGSNAIGKAWSGKHAKTFLPNLYNGPFKGISVALGFILGLPKEPIESFYETHKWANENFNAASYRFNPLYINRKWIDEFSSEFDKNAEKYGYSFPYAGSYENYWKSEITNSKECFDISNKLNDKNGIKIPTYHRYFFLKNMYPEKSSAEILQLDLSNSTVIKNALKIQDLKFNEYKKKFKGLHL